MSLISLPPWVQPLASDPNFLTNTFLFRADHGLVDIMGNTIFDTAATAPLTADHPMFSATSLLFDGTTAKEAISSAGTSGQVNGNTGSGWTMEAWIYLTTTTGSRVLLATTGIASGASTFNLFVNGSNFLCMSDNVQRVTGSIAIPANQIAHVAITKPPGVGATVWINGQPDVTTANFGGQYTVAGLGLGSLTTGGQNFKGAIDSARISKSIRYTAPFTPGQFLPQ